MLRPKESALIAGIISVLVVWIVWAAFDPLALVEDEHSYVLQSRIFASGHWTAPKPPIPEFFEAAHVLTRPAVASKYPPGHALLMSIGSLFGVPALIPLLLTGLTGALLFLLVRRTTNAWVALLAFIIWLGDPLSLRYRAGYYSEVTTEAMWFIASWALLEWRERRERRWLLALAAAIGWGAITRPLTMLAFAVPIGVVVIRDTARFARWRDLGLAMALGTVVLGIIPLWSAETTGDWRLTPQALYTRQYLPYDKPGFGVDSTPPALPLNPVNRFTYEGFFKVHVDHTPGNLPRTAFDRLRVIAREEWRNPRIVLVPFVIIGLFSMNAAVLFSVLCAFALFAGYLSYGHWAEWAVYYFEGLPVLSVLAALGLWRVIELGAKRIPRLGVAVAVLASLLAAVEIRAARADHLTTAAYELGFRDELSHLPARAAVIFIHYREGLKPHSDFVLNSPHLADEPIWIVNDLGERNRELMRYAAPRIPLAFYEEGARFEVDRSLLNR